MDDDDEWDEPEWERPAWHRATSQLSIRIAELERALDDERRWNKRWHDWLQTFSFNASMMIGILAAAYCADQYGWQEYGKLAVFALSMIPYLFVFWFLRGMIKPPSR